MAKPTRHAPMLTLVFALAAVAGLLIGYWRHSPLIAVLLLLPAALYEAYRTEGPSTRWSSAVLSIALVAEALAIWRHVDFNLATWLSSNGQTVADRWVPFGDIKVVFPALVAVLSLLLMARTRGRYTRWLAAVLLVGAVGVVYILDPTLLPSLFRA